MALLLSDCLATGVNILSNELWGVGFTVPADGSVPPACRLGGAVATCAPAHDAIASIAPKTKYLALFISLPGK